MHKYFNAFKRIFLKFPSILLNSPCHYFQRENVKTLIPSASCSVYTALTVRPLEKQSSFFYQAISSFQAPNNTNKKSTRRRCNDLEQWLSFSYQIINHIPDKKMEKTNCLFLAVTADIGFFLFFFHQYILDWFPRYASHVRWRGQSKWQIKK